MEKDTSYPYFTDVPSDAECVSGLYGASPPQDAPLEQLPSDDGTLARPPVHAEMPLRVQRLPGTTTVYVKLGGVPLTRVELNEWATIQNSGPHFGDYR